MATAYADPYQLARQRSAQRVLTPAEAAQQAVARSQIARPPQVVAPAAPAVPAVVPQAQRAIAAARPVQTQSPMMVAPQQATQPAGTLQEQLAGGAGLSGYPARRTVPISDGSPGGYPATRRPGTVPPGIIDDGTGPRPPIDQPGVAPPPYTPGTTTFGPGNDLRDKQLTTTWTPSQLQGGAEYAAMTAGTPSYENIAGGKYAESPDALAVRKQALEALQKSMSGPDRGQLAKEKMALLEEQLNEEERTGVQDIGREAARFGRIGSGVTTSKLGDLGLELGKVRTTEARRLALEAADQEMADRVARTELGLRAGGQIRGEDLDTAGFQQGLREENRGERGFRAQTDLQRANLGLDRSRQLSDLEQQRFGREASLRDEARTERGYQADYAQQDIQNKENEARLQEYLTSGQHGRKMETNRFIQTILEGDNPIPQLEDYARSLEMQGDLDTAAMVRDMIAARKPPVKK